MFLKQKLKKVTNFLAFMTKFDLAMDDENNVNKALQLNKLESHLLKLVIPFIRIGHCPRGSYFKVKGNLIMISADITHSLSRILPNKQKLLPVSFKRNFLTQAASWKKLSTRTK